MDLLKYVNENEKKITEEHLNMKYKLPSGMTEEQYLDIITDIEFINAKETYKKFEAQWFAKFDKEYSSNGAATIKNNKKN